MALIELAEKLCPHKASVTAYTFLVETPCTYISANVPTKAFSERIGSGRILVGLQLTRGRISGSSMLASSVSGTRGAGSDSVDPSRGGKDLAEHHLLGTENGPVQFLGRDGAG